MAKLPEQGTWRHLLACDAPRFDLWGALANLFGGCYLLIEHTLHSVAKTQEKEPLDGERIYDMLETKVLNFDSSALEARLKGSCLELLVASSRRPDVWTIADDDLALCPCRTSRLERQ